MIEVMLPDLPLHLRREGLLPTDPAVERTVNDVLDEVEQDGTAFLIHGGTVTTRDVSAMVAGLVRARIEHMGANSWQRPTPQ